MQVFLIDKNSVMLNPLFDDKSIMFFWLYVLTIYFNFFNCFMLFLLHLMEWSFQWDIKRKSNHVVWNHRLLSDQISEVFLINKKWQRLTQFSITKLLSIYNYFFKKWVNCCYFCLLNFFMVLWFFSNHPVEIFLTT